MTVIEVREEDTVQEREGDIVIGSEDDVELNAVEFSTTAITLIELNVTVRWQNMDHLDITQRPIAEDEDNILGREDNIDVIPIQPSTLTAVSPLSAFNASQPADDIEINATEAIRSTQVSSAMAGGVPNNTTGISGRQQMATGGYLAESTASLAISQSNALTVRQGVRNQTDQYHISHGGTLPENRYQGSSTIHGRRQTQNENHAQQLQDPGLLSPQDNIQSENVNAQQFQELPNIGQRGNQEYGQPQGTIGQDFTDQIGRRQSESGNVQHVSTHTMNLQQGRPLVNAQNLQNLILQQLQNVSVEQQQNMNIQQHQNVHPLNVDVQDLQDT